jgi:nucleoredoxin
MSEQICRSESSFEQYKCSMPWLVIPFERDELRKELATSLDVQGIPSLVLVDADDRIITDEGRQEICDDPKGKVNTFFGEKNYIIL